MSTETMPVPTTPPPAKPAAAEPVTSVEAKIAAAFKTEPAAPVIPPKPEKAQVPPTKSETVPAKTEAPAPVAEKPASLLPRKTKIETSAPAAEVDPDAKYSLPDTAPEEQKSQFTLLKKEARDRLQRIKELEAKVNLPPVPTAELEKLRSEHKAMADRMAVLDLQSHPDFKRQYQEPKTKALAEVQEILTYSGKENVDLQNLLSKDRKSFSAAVTEMTKDLNMMDASTVQNALRDAYRLSTEERGALSKASELQQQLAQRAQAEQRQAFDEVSSNLGTMGEFLVALDVPEGATAEEKAEVESYNQAVSGIRSNVEKTVFGPANEKSMATLGWKGATMDFLLQHAIPRMEKTYSSLVAERNALARELQAIRGAKGSGPIAGDPAKGPVAKTNEQLVAEAYGRR